MRNIVYNMDCMDFLKQQGDKSFDLAIVDPPYGGGQAWGGWFRSQYGVRGRAGRGPENISGKNTVQPRMGGGGSGNIKRLGRRLEP